MKIRVMSSLYGVVVCCLLSACGGGGGGSGPAVVPPPVPVNVAPTARIAAVASVPAGTTLTLDGTPSTDPEGDTLSYSWTLSSAPSGSAAALSGATTARPSLTLDTAGSYTVQLVVNDGRQSSAAVQLVLTATAATPLTITLDKPEPVAGTVQLAVAGGGTGTVTWYIDLALLGSGAATPGGAIAWNTTTVSNASHLVVARIQSGPNAYQEVRRNVVVANSTVLLSASVSGVTGIIAVDVLATSPNGMAAVTGALDGGLETSLAAPNACSRSCGGTNDVYRFTVDAARVGSGSHTLRVVGTDKAGATRTLDVSVPVSNAPGLAISSPADGALLFGTLALAGSASSDKPGGVTVAARLGDVPFLSTTNGTFSGSFDLAGVSPGAYTLTVTVTDSTGQVFTATRKVVVVSAAALAYTPAFTLPAGAQLVAAAGAEVLYTTSDGVRRRHLGTGAEIVLAGAAGIAYATDWQMDGTRAYVQGKGGDCLITCIYQWDAAGTVQNLSNANPYSATTLVGGGRTYDLHPVAHGGQVLWVNWTGPNPGGYTLFDTTAGTYRQIVQPPGVNYVGNVSYDFTVAGAVVRFYFWGQTGGDGTASTFDLFRWQSDTGVTTRVTSGAVRNIYPQTDTQRVAWQQSPVGGNADGSIALLTQPLAGGTTTTLAAKADAGFLLEDGVLAWTETGASSKTLRAATENATSTLSALSSAVLYANGEGRVVYGASGKLYSWNSASGTSTLRLETLPGQVFIAGGAVVFTVNAAVYRVVL